MIISNSILTLIFITKESTLFNLLENILLSYYILEMFIKMRGKFLFKNPNSYFKSGWNIIDFIIIISSVFVLFFPIIKFNLSVFRVIRILNALDIKQLKITVEGMLASFSLMKDSILILLSFMIIYTILGLHLFSELFKKQCFSPFYGIEINNGKIPFCGFNNCENNFICGKLIQENPDFGVTNFDNFYYSFLQVFRIMTFNNWTYLMNLTQKTYNYASIIYFMSLALLGNFFILNLILGVLKMKYSEFENQTKLKEIQLNQMNKINDDTNKYNLKLLKFGNFYTQFQLGNEEVYKINSKRDNYVKLKKINLTTNSGLILFISIKIYKNL